MKTGRTVSTLSARALMVTGSTLISGGSARMPALSSPSSGMTSSASPHPTAIARAVRPITPHTPGMNRPLGKTRTSAMIETGRNAPNRSRNHTEKVIHGQIRSSVTPARM